MKMAILSFILFLVVHAVITFFKFSDAVLTAGSVVWFFFIGFTIVMCYRMVAENKEKLPELTTDMRAALHLPPLEKS